MQDLAEVALALQAKLTNGRHYDAQAPTFTFKCDVCQDKGFVRYHVPDDHPLFGRLFPCFACDAYKTTGAGFMDEYGLYPAERGASWAGILDIDPTITQAARSVKQVLEKGWGWVYIYGTYGTAKTLILKTAVAEYLKKEARPAVYLRMADLMDNIRSAYDSAKPQTEIQRKLKWFTSLGLLAIDEVEKVTETDFVNERRFQILDGRYDLAIQRYGVTILAANVSPDKLEPALRSRVLDGRFEIVHITSKDMRPLGEMLEGGQK